MSPTCPQLYPIDYCDALQQALLQAGLPDSDLRGGHSVALFANRQSAQANAFIGLEAYGKTGLLRSLVVLESARGQGWGRSMVAALEAHARTLGITELYLLTTTAEAFFTQLGYCACHRSQVPEVIRNSRQFSALCPSSALVMMKPLQATTSARAE